MGDVKKSALGNAARIAKVVLSQPHIAVGLPAGVRVETNVAQSARFPLPLTIGSAVVGALGVIATVKGHRLIGGAMVVVAVGGLGAAAAAPELQGALSKLQGSQAS